MNLNDRKIKILQAIIHDYIATAEPVGSRTLSKKYDLGVSSATIRNEMADLEELGYLTQPHTSAGRIPSDKGYRLYVDDLMELKMVADLHRRNMKNSLLRQFGEIEELLQYSAKIISQLTNYTSAVVAPQIKENKIKHIQLVPMDHQNIIVVLVTETGVIKNPVIRVPKVITYQQVEKVSNMLNAKLQGLSIKDLERKILQELTTELHEFNHITEAVVPKLFSSIEKVDDVELFLSGTTNIFNFPEFNDLLKAKSFLRMLEEKEIISSIIASKSNGGISVSIGSENVYKEAQECSLVTATYKLDDMVVGRLSVIGPTRMDYTNVVSTVHQISKYINELIRERYR